jgi:UDP-N-acetylglucosamine 2-epimerase
VLLFSERARQRSAILQTLDLAPGSYLLATLHRAYNTDEPQVLAGLLSAIAAIPELVILPLHPRTQARIAEYGLAQRLERAPSLRIIEPVGYLDMLLLEQNARRILTDSGGVQKEAYFFGVPCLTLRPETEWIETVAAGWNELVGTEPERILGAVQRAYPAELARPPLFGDGQAARKILEHLERFDHV